ncbi:MAG TPA: sulfatase-like hydrolase/transferase [Planctomycetota bacterium]|nr:sulfatase-like hydrolase/transferase [Planctomycetota bacterium]
MTPGLLSGALLALLLHGGEPPRRPNIVLILADDFGHELVGANGGTSYSTPALDRLAETGMRFEHCHAQPLCTPTRVQLLTGLYNQRNYVRFGHLDAGATTFAQVLRQSGYRTCVAGKWQLGGGPDAPRRLGFDEHLLWQHSVRESRYANPVLEKDGEVLRHTGGEYGPDVIADFLCGFIRRSKDAPFFAFHSMLLPHAPFEPTPGSAAWDPKSRGVAPGQGNRKHFADMVAHADRLVGRVVALLDELGLREKTLVIFTGDNGTARAITSRLGARGVRGGKGLTTDAGTRVPLIASWPGVVPRGAVSRDLVDSTDFFPTLLEAAGVPLPAGLTLDGRSFHPQLRGEKGRPREWVYSWFSRDGGPTGVESARTQRFKLYGDGRLFDVAADPDEARDLSRDTLEPETRAARDLLAKAIESFRGTRRVAGVSPAPAPSPEAQSAAIRRLRDLGGTVHMKEDRVVEVVLNRCEITEDLPGLIAGFADMTDLSLEQTAVGDSAMAELARLEKLEWLNLYRTRVGDVGLRHLGRMKSLRLLPIGETRVTDAGLAHLESMAQLEYLGLRGNRITDAGLAHVAKLRELKGLHLGGTSVTDAGLIHLTALEKLEKLWLDGTAITDACVDSLSRLRSLRELHAAGTKLTARGIADLRRALPGCEVQTEG